MRLIHLITLLFLMITGFINPALAAESITVRAGAHDEYSRLVFEGPASASYTLDKSTKGTLVINFKKGGALDAAAAQKTELANIRGISVLSQDPLKVSLAIPEGSKIRDMLAGDRLIIDVYNAPGAKPKPEPLKVENKAPQKTEEKKAEEKTEAKPAEKIEDKKEEKTAAEEAAAATPPTAQPEAGKSFLEPVIVKSKGKASPTIVSLSSTQNFGLAAFTYGGHLFLVNDKSDLLLEPQISGPQSKQMSALAEIKADQGKVHVLTLAAENKLQAQGGGLVWRLLVSPDVAPEKGIDPERKDVKRDIERSGKILWPLESARNVIQMTDPQTGQTIVAVTVESADMSAGRSRSFVDFDVLDSAIGLAIIPKVDDLEVTVVGGNVQISRPGGLSLVDQTLFAAASVPPPTAEQKNPTTSQRVFDFKSWQLGGVKAVADNRTILLGGLKDLTDGAKIESLLTLGKMYISNGLAPEAKGVLGLAEAESPSIKESPEFMALRGAAHVLNQENEEGLADLSIEGLKPFEEINYWKAAALANLGDWQQAATVMPKSVGAIADYPEEVQNRIALVLSEIALRSGNVPLGEQFLALVNAHEKVLRDPQRAALNYLKGEAARQNKNLAETKKLWEPLTTGPDDLYRAKAGLALTRLKVDNKELLPVKAIDNLERLRYAWRGDELEAQINSWLGRTYFESGDYIKGLKIMRDAATYVPGTALAQRIAGDMSDVFSGLFLGPDLEKVSPLDAVALYNQFTELVPQDERGDQIVEKLAEHLVKSDLMGRAGDLLNFQLQKRLQGEAAYTTAERLAAIRLLDGDPQKALAALNLAEQKFSELPEEMKTAVRKRKLVLLRARALSKDGHPDKAIKMLNDMAEATPETNALRADIAWKAGYWDDAAEALGDVILDQNISMTRPLEKKQVSLLMQNAIALNLASNRIALANLREKYSELMNQTDKAKIFEVITRPRQSGALADRDTLLGAVNEVDLFSDFLNSYKTMKEPLN
jgi:hypothetical protein